MFDMLNTKPDFGMILIALLSMTLGYFLRRTDKELAETLRKIIQSQDRLWAVMDEVCKQLNTLQGEHNAMHTIEVSNARHR